VRLARLVIAVAAEESMRRLTWVCWMGIAVAGSASWASAAGRWQSGAQGKGAQLYKTHCASCHGTAGRGDGPVAEFLTVRPADLTGIAARNRGAFPAEVVHRIIDGRRVLKTHGDSAMPIWGDAFSLSHTAEAEKATSEKIRALVAYIETLQQRSGD
jgi:mono/diheme cytochrome c family protein